MLRRIIFVTISIVQLSLYTYAQNNNPADTARYLTLEQCIAYALQHQPALNEAVIGIDIARKTNAIALSSWLPQVNLTGTLTHYFTLPTVVEINPVNPTGPPLLFAGGIANTATPAVDATETIFSPQLLYAAKSAHLYVQQAQQSRDSTQIALIANVSTAFYNLLLTLEQVDVLKGDTAELKKNLSDAYHQYIGGTVDKTDYEEATITLNNTLAQLRQTVENAKPQYSTLKQTMGYPPEKEFNVIVDTLQMMQDIAFDTTQQLQYEKRIEYQQLQTAKSLQHQNVNYYRLAWLPTITGFYDYIHEFESSSFPNLFNTAYPYSYIGLSATMPIFTGFGRIKSVQRAKLQEQIIDWNIIDLKANIYTQYTTALASYKGNLYDYQLLNQNKLMAKDTYGVVSLQYREGIVPYLNVITAQTNLISSEISYVNALFQVLISKVALQKAMGYIPAK